MKCRYLKFQILKKYQILYIWTILSLCVVFIFHNFYQRGQLNYQYYISTLEISENETQQKMADALKQSKIDKYLDLKIKYNETYIEDGNIVSSYDEQYIRNEISFDKYLLQNHIQPLSYLVDYNHINQVTGITSIYIMLKEILPLIIPIISLFVTMINIHNDNKMKYYLLSLPINKKTFRKTQLFSSISVSFISILFLLFISFIVGSIHGGIGELKYPIVMNTVMIEMTDVQLYMSLWLFVLLSLCIVFLQIVTYCVIAYMITIIINKPIIDCFLGILIGILPVLYVFVFHPFASDMNHTIQLIPFVSDCSNYILTQGYKILKLVNYFMILVVIISIGVYWCIKKLVREYV